MKVYEVMDSAVEWKWDEVDTNGGIATFYIDRNFYVVTIEEPVENVYHIQFALDSVDGKSSSIDDRHGISDTGNQLLVFGTVKEIIVYFLKHEASEDALGIFFSAKEPSRQKLYSRFLKMAQKLGLQSTAEEQGKKDRFYIMAWDPMGLEDIIQVMGLG